MNEAAPASDRPGAEPSVAALMLNYNGRDVTLLSLSSLVQLDYGNVEIVVVDNGSTDGSEEAIRAAYPEITQLRVEENRGISWGLNHGLVWAIEQAFDYVLILNNDIEVAPDLLTRLVEVAERSPRAAAVGPKSYYYSDRERLWSAGGILRFRESITRERGDGELDEGQYDEDEVVPYINGCAMLTPQRALVEVGLWDPVYYLGVEDADWCTRARRRGYECVYAHRARLWHMISHSIGVYKPTRTFHTGRSTAIYLRRYANLWQWICSLGWFVVSIPVAFLRELPRGNQAAATSKLKGFVAGLRTPLPPPPRTTADERDS